MQRDSSKSPTKVLRLRTGMFRPLTGGLGWDAVTAARKTGGRARTARPSSTNAREVRLWAVDQGLPVNSRGRIQADIMEKYETAH